MSDSRFILRGSLLNMGGMIARTIFSLLNILLPRVFSQATFGMFVSLQSFVYATSTLVGLGLNQGMQWWIPRLKAENRFSSGTVWNGFRLVMISSTVIVLVVTILFALFHSLLPKTLHEIPVIFFCICMAAIPANVVLYYSCGSLMGIRKPQYTALYAQFLSISLVTVIALILSLTHLSYALAWSLLSANLLCAGIVIYHLRRHIPPEPMPRLMSIDKKLLDYSLPIAFYSTVISALECIDLWLVFMILGAKKAALYGITLMLAGGVVQVSRSYSRLIVPVVSGMDSNTLRIKLKDVFSYSVNMVLMIQFAIVFTMFFFPKELLSLAGTQYSVDTVPFLILVISYLIVGYSELSGQVILGLGKSSILLWIDLTILVFATIMNALLIPEFGMRGAALSTLTAYSTRGFIYVTIQTRLAGQWLYNFRVMLNAVWMAIVFICIVIIQPQIASLSFFQRIPLFLTAMSLYALWVWRNREQMSPRY